jgi:hypothetical protein
MKVEETSNESRDILRNRWLAGAVYWLPALAVITSGFFNIGQGWRTAVWVVALSAMGAGCVANALRCGRVHCYLTGPFFLVMAIVALLYGLGVVPLGGDGWNVLGLLVLVGALALWFIPEVFFGRYRQGHVTGPPFR